MLYRLAIISLVLGRAVDAFVTPRHDFLLDFPSSVSTAVHTVCAIEQKVGEDVGGRVKCWSHNEELEMQSPNDETFVQVVAGSSFACALSVERTVRCWGVGIQAPQEDLYATQLAGGGSGEAVCAIRTDQSLFCWGSAPYAYSYPQEGSFVQVSCSSNHCCALDTMGYPHCWGGMIGRELHGRGRPENEPPLVTREEFEASRQQHGWIVKEEDGYEDEEEPGSAQDVSKVQFRQVSVADSISCGVSLLGSHIYCWGASSLLKQGVPRQLRGPFRQVSVGNLGMCAITADHHESEKFIGEDEAQAKKVKNENEDKAQDLYEDEVEKDEGPKAADSVATNKQTSSSSPAAAHAADEVVCFSHIKNLFDAKRFEAWDQVTLGPQGACGVSVYSDLVCFGPHYPKEMHRLIQDIIVA
eukprot:gene34164-41355_t